MADKDLQQLRQVLREAVQASRMPIREMERRLGIGHGAIYRMLDGELIGGLLPQGALLGSRFALNRAAKGSWEGEW